MPLTDVKNKLDALAVMSSKNDKRDLLKAYLSNNIFAEAIALMLDEKKSFKINELPQPEEGTQPGRVAEIFKFLNALAKSKGVSDENKQHMANLAGYGATREVVLKILNKKSDAGFGLRSVATVAPWLLFQTPYQRCSGAAKLDRISYPAYVQKKADGMFSYGSTFFDEGLGLSGTFLSRRGKDFNLFGHLKRELNLWNHKLKGKVDKPVLLGELTVLDECGVVLPRKTGNGIINKFIKGKGTEEEARSVVFTVWDVLPMDSFLSGSCFEPYEDRWQTIVDAHNQPISDEDAPWLMQNKIECGSMYKIMPITSEEVDDVSQARSFYKRMRDQGEEGAILKSKEALWKSNTSPLMVKMKHFVQAEFEIVSVKEGKGKYTGKMGALEVMTRDGIITCSVGSGFSDEERESIEYWEENLGNVVTLQFESVITDKKTGMKSLFIPTFVETRFEEKTEADSAKYIEGLD
jgi:hypothetical protein